MEFRFQTLNRSHGVDGGYKNLLSRLHSKVMLSVIHLGSHFRIARNPNIGDSGIFKVLDWNAGISKRMQVLKKMLEFQSECKF